MRTVFGERVDVVGRDAELRILDDCVAVPGLVLVRGAAGIGKTALLNELRRRALAREFRVVSFDCGTDVPEWDEFGTRPVIESVRGDVREIGDPRVAAAMAAVVRGSTPRTPSSPAARAALFAALVRLFFWLRGKGTLAVLADDVHSAPAPGLVVSAARQAGCAVVATCRAGVGVLPTSLSETAVRVLDLAPLPGHAVNSLVEALARTRLDEAVAPAIRTALGSLHGNPGTVAAVFAKLARDGRFAAVIDHLCLADPDVPIALPADHLLVRHVARFGETGARLVALAHRMDRFGIDDLVSFAAATGADLDACGLAVDELVVAGALDCDSEGVLSVPCPALVPAACPEDMAGVHRAIAEHLMRSGDAFPAAVADHLAPAGPALSADPAAGALLEREAARMRRNDPVASARWYRAALWHCEPGSATHSRVLAAALRLLVEVGDYRCLGEVVAETVAAGFDETMRYELAVAAALAAVHLGGPVPEPVRAALAAEAAGRAPLEFAAAFGAGSYAFDRAQLEAAFGAFRGGGSRNAEGVRGLEQAGDQHDILTVNRLLAGAGYGEPRTGPMATFGRMTRDFARGDWAGIPSDARRLELTSGVTPAITQFTRVIAAEAYSALGESDRAAQWLAKVSAGFPFRAVRTWVEIGIAYRAGDWDRARQRGWAAYPAIVGGPVVPGDLVGLRWFFVRMGYLEKQAGNTEKLRLLHRDVTRLRARHPGVTLRIAELILRGLAENDYAAATEAVEVLRRHGNRPELMRALVTAAFTADDPRPWYDEAYEIARQLGGDWLRTNVRSVMRASGVAGPSERDRPVPLTGMEERIIGLIQQGLTNRQIAVTVRLKEKTVESYLTRLYAKTGCRSRVDLATAGLEGRLVSGSR